MQVTDIVILLLFVLPGVLTQKIIYLLDMPSDKQHSEFGEIVNGILLSLPIMFGACMIGIYKSDITTVQQFIEKFDDANFLISFSKNVLIIAVITGIVLGLIKDYLVSGLNIIKKYVLKRPAREDKSAWRKVFLDKPGFHYVEIIKDGVLVEKGFIELCSIPGEEKELTFVDHELAEKNKDKFNKVRCTYVNLEKNIVIKDYDTKEYKDFCKDKDKKMKNKNKINITPSV